MHISIVLDWPVNHILCKYHQWIHFLTHNVLLFLMGEGFIRGLYTPFTILFDFWLRSLRYEKDFLPVSSKLSQASMVKIFHFSDKWKVVYVAPQRGVYTPFSPIKLEVFFSDILATASRLNTLYGLQTWYVQSSRHVRIIEKFWGISDIFDIFMTSSMSEFYVILQFLKQMLL